MTVRILRVLVPLSFFGLTALSQEVRVSVTNPSAVARENEPVVIPWDMVRAGLSGLTDVGVKDEQGTRVVAQTDDLDFDGKPDELTFMANFEAGEERVFTVLSADKGVVVRQRTDAQNYKRIKGMLQPIDDDDVPGAGRERGAYRFDGVGWESEIAGYRLYLDERNATDIQAKRIPGLYWKWIGQSGVDYQINAFWGMDILHVGPALGIGGIGFWVGDSVLKPLTLDRQRTRIVARGPVRAAVKVEYFGWNLGNEKVDVASLFSIYAGDRISEHRVTLTTSGPPRTLVTGIVAHDSTRILWNPEAAWLYTAGIQSRAGDSLLMALTLSPASVIGKTGDAYNQLVLLKAESNRPLRFLISSYWQGETGRMWTNAEINDFMKSTTRRLNEPLTVRVR